MIFLTGGTGFLGMSLVARLLEDDDGPDIVLAVRARDAAAARAAMQQHLKKATGRYSASWRRANHS